MSYVNFFLIVSSLFTMTLLVILKHKVNQQLQELNDIREYLAKSKDAEPDYRTALMTRLGEVQHTRFSNYFKNRGD